MAWAGTALCRSRLAAPPACAADSALTASRPLPSASLSGSGAGASSGSLGAAGRGGGCTGSGCCRSGGGGGGGGGDRGGGGGVLAVAGSADGRARAPSATDVARRASACLLLLLLLGADPPASALEAPAPLEPRQMTGTPLVALAAFASSAATRLAPRSTRSREEPRMPRAGEPARCSTSPFGRVAGRQTTTTSHSQHGKQLCGARGKKGVRSLSATIPRTDFPRTRRPPRAGKLRARVYQPRPYQRRRRPLVCCREAKTASLESLWSKKKISWSSTSSHGLAAASWALAIHGGCY